MSLIKANIAPISDFMNGTGHLMLSKSRAESFLRCKAFFYWEYIEGLKPIETPYYLAVGSVVHYLLAEYYNLNKTINDYDEYIEAIGKKINSIRDKIKTELRTTDEKADEITLEAFKLFSGYLEKYKSEQFKVIETEIMLSYKNEIICHNEVLSYVLTGVIDTIVEYDGKIWQMEHKTSSRNDSYYLNGLRNSIQARLYHVLLSENDYHPTGIIYNLLIKRNPPEYKRHPLIMTDRTARYVMMVFNGIARELFNIRNFVMRGNNDIMRYFYPDLSACYKYNNECRYAMLCKASGDNERLNRAKMSFVKGVRINNPNEKREE